MGGFARGGAHDERWGRRKSVLHPDVEQARRDAEEEERRLEAMAPEERAAYLAERQAKREARQEAEAQARGERQAQADLAALVEYEADLTRPPAPEVRARLATKEPERLAAVEAHAGDRREVERARRAAVRGENGAELRAFVGALRLGIDASQPGIGDALLEARARRALVQGSFARMMRALQAVLRREVLAAVAPSPLRNDLLTLVERIPYAPSRPSSETVATALGKMLAEFGRVGALHARDAETHLFVASVSSSDLGAALAKEAWAAYGLPPRASVAVAATPHGEESFSETAVVGRERLETPARLMAPETVHASIGPAQAALPVAKLSKSERRWRAAKLGAPHIPDELLEQIMKAVPIVIGGWMASHMVGVGELVDVAALLLAAGGTVSTVKDLYRFWTDAGVAASEEELEEAGRHFAAVASSVALIALPAGLAKLPRGPKPVAAAPEQHAIAELFARSPELVAEFPHLGKLAPTKSNLDGLKRIADTFDDLPLTPELRQQYLAELKAKVGALELPPSKLFQAMNEVSHARTEVYLRTGVRSSAEYIEHSMGGLSRAVSLRAMLFSLTSDEWLARAGQVIPRLPPRSKLDWETHGPELVRVVKSGEISFDCTRDLNPAALVKGPSEGSSGWYFSRADAGSAIKSPRTMVTKLAVESDYRDGYLLLELSTEAAVAHGAARPTALDLTHSPAGRLNPNAHEPAGRTHPTELGQKQVRELVLPPLPLSTMAKITFVKGD